MTVEISCCRYQGRIQTFNVEADQREYWIVGRSVVVTYTCGSWQQGSRKKSTHASGRGGSGDLEVFIHQPSEPNNAVAQIDPIPVDCSQRHFLVNWKVGRTNRIVGTECASCCDAYRNWRYPSLQNKVSTGSSQSPDLIPLAQAHLDSRFRHVCNSLRPRAVVRRSPSMDILLLLCRVRQIIPSSWAIGADREMQNWPKARARRYPSE